MKLVIIGNGMVGYKFCEKLRAKGKGQFEVVKLHSSLIKEYTTKTILEKQG